jgi:murein DD-endopeptidase MepM/ murein hydrolase activator NlpD
MVALATAHTLPDQKVDPAALNAASLSTGSATGLDAASRQANADRANRAANRSDAQSLTAVAPDLWALPLQSYTLAASSSTTAGLDLVVPEGTTFYAAHSGTVTLARWAGGYGYCVLIDTGNGTTLVYAHAATLLVQEGQKVQAGDAIGLTGSTGYALTPRLHFEIRQQGNTIDATQYLLAHGVDVVHQTQAIDS